MSGGANRPSLTKDDVIAVYSGSTPVDMDSQEAKDTAGDAYPEEVKSLASP